MCKRAYLYIVLLSIFYSEFSISQSHIVPIQELDVSRYANGTHFSVVFDPNNPSRMWASPTEGAKFTDGSLVPRDMVVARNGGHREISRLMNPSSQWPAQSEIRGGGFRVEDGQIQYSYRSRSTNSFTDNLLRDGLLSPQHREVLETSVPRNLASSQGNQRGVRTTGNCMLTTYGSRFGTMANIVGVAAQGYAIQSQREELQLLQSGGCPSSPHLRTDDFWTLFFNRSMSVIGPLSDGCIGLRRALFAYEERIVAHLKGMIDPARRIVCQNGRVQLSLLNPKSLLTYDPSRSEIIVLPLTESTDVAATEPILRKNISESSSSIEYRTQGVLRRESRENFENRVLCYARPSECAASGIQLVQFDDQQGVSFGRPFGSGVPRRTVENTMNTHRAAKLLEIILKTTQLLNRGRAYTEPICSILNRR